MSNSVPGTSIRTPGTDGVLALSALDGTNGFTLTGIDARDDSGYAVSPAGDVNGDGYDDLIVGATGADPNEAFNAGETYVVHGGATGTESVAPVMAQGTGSADNFTGNAGADTFTEIASGDVMRGGAGNDRISVTSLDFAHIDGGTVWDKLVLTGSGLSLDLTHASAADVDVDSVELLDLSGTGAYRLVLDALAVFDVTEERDGGRATLDVLGDADDADDTVDLSGANSVADSTETEAGTTYNVYRGGNAQVRVQDGVVVTLAASESASLGQSSLWGGSFRADGCQSLDRSDSHGLNEAPVFEDLSVRESIPDMQAAAAGEDDVLMPFPLPSVAPMSQSVLESGTPMPI